MNKMTYRDYINRYISSDILDKYSYSEFDYDRSLEEFDDKVELDFGRGPVSIELSDLWRLFGFKEEYSVKNKLPRLADVWSDKNIMSADEAFIKANMLVIAEISGETEIIDLLNYKPKKHDSLNALYK